MTNTINKQAYKQYSYEAISSTPAEKHIHCTRVMKGEKYMIAKTDDPEFISITGYLYCKDGGKEKVFNKHLHISRVKPYVIPARY